MVGMKRVYKTVNIMVLTGDVTKQKVGAIVNPANSLMIMGGGVAGAIKRAGGKEIEDEAIKHAPVAVGKAIATGAGRLGARYVVHAPTMEMPAMRIDKGNVRSAVRGALECAKQLRIETIVFPGMGTGVGGLSLEEAARTMVSEIRNHIDEGTSLNQIVLVGFTRNLAYAFEKAISEIVIN
jgi:O-acetyl-ADP-ribose deacetylase (regulator of RNase III)